MAYFFKETGVRRPPTFSQIDVTRAIKAALAAGMSIARVEIDKAGKIVIITGKPGSMAVSEDPLDRWLADNESET